MMTVERQYRIRAAKRHCGFTLVEMMVALSIFAFASAAVGTLMFTSFKTNKHAKNMLDSTNQAELAMRRITELARSTIYLRSVNLATGVYDAAQGVTLTTPPDAENLCYNVTYYVKSNQLWEKIELTDGTPVQNNGQNHDHVIVENLKSFSVERATTTFPEVYNIVIEVKTNSGSIVRRMTVCCRNRQGGTEPNGSSGNSA